MKTLKKTLCLVLAVVMVVGALVLPASAKDYGDKASIDKDYTTAVTNLTTWQIMEGDANGNFKPEASIQRQEMAAIVYRLLTGDTAGYGKDNSGIYANLAAETFTDVKATDWAAGYIGYCANKGIIVGIGAKNAEGKDRFDPARKIPNIDVLCMLLRAVGYGKNSEYQGKEWKDHIAADANRLNLTKGLKSKLDTTTASQRQEVALLTYNASQAARVTWSDSEKDYIPYVDPNDPTYSATNKSLIVAKDTKATYKYDDVWGEVVTDTAPKTELTFTYPVPAVTKTITGTADSKLKKVYYDAVTECDVVKDIGASDGEHWAITYTNGIKNVNLWNGNVRYDAPMAFQAKDTVNKIGHEGRYFAVYENHNFDTTKAESAANPKYIFVFKDIYLAKVTSVWGAATDPAGHVIRAAGAKAEVYYNTASVGAGSATAPLKDVTVTGTFTVGQIIAVNMINTVGTIPNANVAVATSSAKDPKAEPTTVKGVTIDSITTEGTGANSRTVGFKADGKQYYYNYTFASNVLKGTDIGNKFDLVLGYDDDVLAVTPADTTSGFGIVTNSVVKATSTGGYVLSTTILLPNNTTTTIDVGTADAAGKVYQFGTQQAADNDRLDYIGDLVNFTSKNGGYYVLTSAVKAVQTTVFESGRANAAFAAYTGNDFVTGSRDTSSLLTNSTNYPRVNDDTVFFVVEYLPDNTTDDKNDYKATAYKIYNGFKSLPDLAVEGGSKVTAKNGTLETPTGIDVYAFVVEDGVGRAAKPGEYAKYVLLTNGTKQTMPPAKDKASNYAFLMTGDSFKQRYASYFTFKPIIDGVAGETLTVALTDGENVNDYGLYTYEVTVNGYSSIKKCTPIAADAYSYAKGVLREEVTGDNLNPKLYTVIDDCPVWLVNPTTGSSVKIGLGYLDKDIYGETCPIFYQLNEFGQISLIYVVDSFTNPGGTEQKPDTTKTYKVTLVNKGAVGIAGSKNLTTTNKEGKVTFEVTVAHGEEVNVSITGKSASKTTVVSVSAKSASTTQEVYEVTITGITEDITVTLSPTKKADAEATESDYTTNKPGDPSNTGKFNPASLNDIYNKLGISLAINKDKPSQIDVTVKTKVLAKGDGWKLIQDCANVAKTDSKVVKGAPGYVGITFKPAEKTTFKDFKLQGETVKEEVTNSDPMDVFSAFGTWDGEKMVANKTPKDYTVSYTLVSEDSEATTAYTWTIHFVIDDVSES